MTGHIDRRHPDLWTAPRWHPDHGDAQQELEMLRAFAKRVTATYPGEFDAGLDCDEPGYMHLVFTREDREFADVHIVEGERDPRYGLFLEKGAEKEHYFTDPAEGLQYFDRLVEFRRLVDPSSAG